MCYNAATKPHQRSTSMKTINRAVVVGEKQLLGQVDASQSPEEIERLLLPAKSFEVYVTGIFCLSGSPLKRAGSPFDLQPVV